MYCCVNPDSWNQFKFSMYRVSSPPFPSTVHVTFNLLATECFKACVWFSCIHCLRRMRMKLYSGQESRVPSPVTLLSCCPTQLPTDQSQKSAVHSETPFSQTRTEILSVIAKAPNISTHLPFEMLLRFSKYERYKITIWNKPLRSSRPVPKFYAWVKEYLHKVTAFYKNSGSELQHYFPI